jgi:parvulin-like peptidyl-prolyl isomerase
VLREELADAAFKLKPGETSSVIETPAAFYILRVEEKQEARVKPLPDVRDQIEKLLLGKERTRLQQAWIDKLRKKTYIRAFPY